MVFVKIPFRPQFKDFFGVKQAARRYFNAFLTKIYCTYIDLRIIL